MATRRQLRAPEHGAGVTREAVERAVGLVPVLWTRSKGYWYCNIQHRGTGTGTGTGTGLGGLWVGATCRLGPLH